MTVWAQESCDRYDDPVSGARVIQLTSSAMTSNNIYCEQPYTSPDGKRIAIIRKHDFCWDETSWLLVHELDTLKITLVDREVAGGISNAAWGGFMYYWTPQRQLVRISLTTLEKEVMYVEADEKATIGGGSVSPDHRYFIMSQVQPNRNMAVVRIDLQKKKREVIFEHPEITNPHLQFNPITGADILVQHNRGSSIGPDGTVQNRVTAQGTTLFVIDVDGNNQRSLPVGQPSTAGATGHECFVADTGKVLFSVAWNHSDWSLDSRFPEGNIFTARPGDAKPTVFKAPEHRFNHVCASRCGRYFVADSHEGGIFDPRTKSIKSVCLVVGNLETGKYRTLVQDTLASGGGNQCTHSHPYLTADNRHVIFNAAPYYSPAQVFAARLPDGFLKSLD